MSGGGGAAPLNGTAEACTANDACEGDACISEDLSGWAAGYCTQLCDPTFAPCAASEECVMLTDAASFCLAKCATNADCKGPGQTCVDLYGDGTALACVGGCDMDSQCSVSCNNDVGSCTTTPEVCANNKDDDGEGFSDCEDADCAADTTCQTTIAGACTDAVDVSAGGPLIGSTTGGTNAFATVCQSLFGSSIAGSGENERVYKYTATEAGNLSLDVTTTTGSVDWYVRKTCDDWTTTLGICGTEVGGPSSFPVNAGDTLFIYLDGYQGDADFTLDVSFAALGPVCAAAVTAADGANTGDTTTGTAALSSSCGGGGKEVVYTYTPTATGMLDLVLASATDLKGLQADFNLQDVPDAQGLQWVLATPKSKDGQVQSVKVGVRGNELAALDILDSFGQRSQLVFSKLEINTALPASTFDFKPPAGADVIRP